MSSRSDILELWGVPTSRESRAVLAGAGVFVTTVVAGGIALVKPFTAASRPFLRDVIFYMVAVFLTFVVLYVGRIRLGEALGERYGSWGWWEQPGGNGGSLGVMWQPGGAVTPPPSLPHLRLLGALRVLRAHRGALHLDPPAAAGGRAGPSRALGAR